MFFWGKIIICFFICLRKCLRFRSWAQAKLEKCNVLVPAFVMLVVVSFVSLYSFVPPLWMTGADYANEAAESSMGNYHSRGWALEKLSLPLPQRHYKLSWERIASSNALSSPMAEQMHQVRPGFHRVCPGHSKRLFNLECICSDHLKRVFSAYCLYTSSVPMGKNLYTYHLF